MGSSDSKESDEHKNENHQQINNHNKVVVGHTVDVTSKDSLPTR